ncbi:MAG: hypothetical protein H0V29_12220 [Thermoleophilaceae bacterium]|nr:hypothetical protein [Thermoleophilaceae bacterium]
MSDLGMGDVEQLLRNALVPVEPPERLSERLERTLSEVTDAAAGELADWELEIGDPRNWARPVIAATALGVAGASLAVVRARRHAKKKDTHGLRAIEHSLEDVLGQVRKRLDG